MILSHPLTTDLRRESLEKEFSPKNSELGAALDF